MRQKIQLTAAALAACLVAPSAQATNGYLPHGFGTNSKGMAGAGSALPQDPFIVYSNPAGLAHLERRFDVDVNVFMPHRKYRANEIPGAMGMEPIPVGTWHSDNDLFLIPGFAMNLPIDDENTLGVSLQGNGGMNTKYDNPVFRNFSSPGNVAGGHTGIDYAQLALAITYAHKLTPNQSIGITPMLAGQRVRVKGLQPFQPFSTNPDKVTNNGYDYSYGGGVRIGWLATWLNRFDVGISYQTKLWMSDFDDYEGLFAGGGELDIPPVLNIGLAIKLIPSLTLALDYKRIYYGDIDALSNDNTDPSAGLGGNNGLGFGWNDINVYSIGLQYEMNDKWTFRTGFSHGEEPWDGVNTLFNILAPATIKNHASIGATYNLTKDSSIVASFTHAFENKIHGTSSFTGPQTGYVEMYQNDFQIGYSRHF